jgi:DNA gyrase inhibitor GyrI
VASILTIPMGRYAIAVVRCHDEQLLSAWDWLCSTWREAHAAPYEQRWNYEVFHYADDGNLSPERGIELCLRLSD